MALLVVLSVMSGFHQDLQKKILGANAHIIIRDYKGALTDTARITENLASNQEVLSHAPFVIGQVMVSFNNRAHGVYIRGIEPEIEAKTTEIFHTSSRVISEDSQRIRRFRHHYRQGTCLKPWSPA